MFDTTTEQQQYLMENINGLSPDRAEKIHLMMPIDKQLKIAKPKEINFNHTAAPHSYGVRIESKIKTTEVDSILAVIKEHFADKAFQNKDLSPFITDLTPRQIPSRLKKLVESGELKDKGGSPKFYSL